MVNTTLFRDARYRQEARDDVYMHRLDPELSRYKLSLLLNYLFLTN